MLQLTGSTLVCLHLANQEYLNESHAVPTRVPGDLGLCLQSGWDH